MVLSIDPGADAGWALFDNRHLVNCGLGQVGLGKALQGAWTTLERVLIERPVIYPGGRQKARPNDIIKLAVVAGEYGGSVKTLTDGRLEPEYVEPSTWKGQVRKDIHQTRIWAKLTGLEQSIVDHAGKGVAPSKRHNIVDAVGIGLYAVGRRA